MSRIEKNKKRNSLLKLLYINRLRKIKGDYGHTSGYWIEKLIFRSLKFVKRTRKGTTK